MLVLSKWKLKRIQNIWLVVCNERINFTPITHPAQTQVFTAPSSASAGRLSAVILLSDVWRMVWEKKGIGTDGHTVSCTTTKMEWLIHVVSHIGKSKGGGKGIGAFIDIATCYTSAEGLANTAEKQKNTPFSSDPTVPACCDQFTVLVWGEPRGRKSTSTWDQDSNKTKIK